MKIELVSSYPAQPFTRDCKRAVERAAQKLGYSNMPVSIWRRPRRCLHGAWPQRHDLHPCGDGISHQRDRERRGGTHHRRVHMCCCMRCWRRRCCNACVLQVEMTLAFYSERLIENGGYCDF